VTVTVDTSVKLVVGTTAQAKLLKVCLGDSDGDSSTNLEKMMVQLLKLMLKTGITVLTLILT